MIEDRRRELVAARIALGTNSMLLTSTCKLRSLILAKPHSEQKLTPTRASEGLHSRTKLARHLLPTSHSRQHETNSRVTLRMDSMQQGTTDCHSQCTLFTISQKGAVRSCKVVCCFFVVVVAQLKFSKWPGLLRHGLVFLRERSVLVKEGR